MKAKREQQIKTTGKKLNPIAAGDFILLYIPKADPLNCLNLIGKILKIKKPGYHIGTS